MNSLGNLVLIACCALAAPVSAQQRFSGHVQPQYQGQSQPQAQWQQSPPVIQRIYVSPGASGRVDSSSSWQRNDGYGGVQVPRGYGESHSNTVIIDQSGSGIRQSIEYPNGAVYPYTRP
ncbi:hypothetical protein [Pseudomonas sp. SCB32]|uniref:hypothetical protein n=1 Tax=Pseudomonas sp. SCB32 TaxID=2653853 RepID=UPI0012647723|nr:hypothetical protein [Pseudomonas sp. SCB32]